MALSQRRRRTREGRRRGEGEVRGQRGNMKEKSHVPDRLNKINIGK